jgi:hypothetical protein
MISNLFSRSTSLVLLMLAAPLAVACTSDDAGDGSTGTGGDTADEPPPDTEPDPETKKCPVTTSGPTVHEAGAIETDETWTADASPHVVNGFIAVRKATLTIEPCAVVQFRDAYAGLTIAFPGNPTTGNLVAEGTADQPILFEGKDGAEWGHVLVEGGGTARLAHLTITDGGGYDTRGATLIVQGDGTMPTKRDVFVDHVTIERSRGAGVVLDRLGGFTADSDALTIVGSGSDDTVAYPVQTDEHGIDTLPRGHYTRNLRDGIYVDPKSHLGQSGTMKNLGVPYVVGSFPGDHFVVGNGSDGAQVTLTIEAGTTVKMHPGTGFEIEHYTGEFTASGAVVAHGTAAEPIVFTSAADVPAAGDWRGLSFGGVARTENSFQHVRIEYSGAWCGCILTGCSAVEGYEGAIIFSQQPPRAFFENTVVTHGAANGVVLGYEGTKVDMAAGITFEDVAGCRQTLPNPGSCPNPLPACE